jgi:hypothetical protein
MLRREFLTLLGEVAVLPYEARVQQSAVIGCLHPIFRDTNADHLRAFRQGLKDRGVCRERKRDDCFGLGVSGGSNAQSC